MFLDICFFYLKIKKVIIIIAIIIIVIIYYYYYYYIIIITLLNSNIYTFRKPKPAHNLFIYQLSIIYLMIIIIIINLF